MSSSSGNDELVSQFMAFTGCDDATQASSYLEMSGNNVETAVGLYIEHGGGGGGGGNSAAGAAASMMEDAVRAPDATRRDRLLDDHMPLADPTYHLMNAMMEEQMQTAFAAPMRVDARAAVNAAAEESKQAGMDDDGGDEEAEYNYEDEEEDEEVQMIAGPTPAGLADMFAAPTHLIHSAGGFQGARASARDSRRWLLVNIQRDSEFASHALNRDVWRDELVENLIREGFILWQAFDTSPDGRTYVERYAVGDFPHIAIIDPRTGRLLWRKEGWTLENPVTAETFAEMAMDFCSRNSFDRPPQAPRPGAPPPAAAVARPPKRSMQDMTEDEQMAAALRASMEDVGKADVAVDDDDDDDDNEVQVVDSMDSKPAAVEAPTASVIDELLQVQVGDEPAKGARLQLRMPDGKRVVRKFAADDAVRMIYAFVAQSNDEARGGREFSLMAGFPPSDLLIDIDKTIGDCQLSGQAITVRWKE